MTAAFALAFTFGSAVLVSGAESVSMRFAHTRPPVSTSTSPAPVPEPSIAEDRDIISLGLSLAPEPASVETLQPADSSDLVNKDMPMTDTSQIDTYIVSLSQTDATCPSERSCPGLETIAQLCHGQHFSNFKCDTSWSSGLAGFYVSEASDDDALEPLLREAVRAQCPGCDRGMKILTIRDSPLTFTI